jgi:hypothetical protein
MDKNIPQTEIEKYLNKVLKYLRRQRSERLAEILEFLVRAELNHQKVSQKVILQEVYKNIGDTNVVGQAVVRLRDKLKKYYGDEDDGAEDEIEFASSVGETRIEILRRQKPVEELLGRIKGRFGEVECYYVGNDQDGIEYVIEQMPYLSVLRDTHVRPKEGYDEFKQETLKQFQQSLTDFLSRNSANRLSLIVGHGQLVDKKYLQIFSAIPDEHQDQVRCRRLRYPGSFLNFIILDYAERRADRTVMFGWGRQGNEHQEAVFLSRDTMLVEEFDELYGALNSATFSEEVRDLTEFSPESGKPIAPLRQADTIHIFSPFPEASVHEEMGRCKRLRLITTGYSSMSKWKFPIGQALENGARVEVILSHPECAFIRLRGESIKSNISAMSQTNREVLRELKDTGDLTVRLTSEVLSTSHIQLDGLIYFTMFWTHKGTFDGPMLLTHESTETGKFLVKQFNELWRLSQEDDLSEDVPEPNSYHRNFHLTLPE